MATSAAGAGPTAPARGEQGGEQGGEADPEPNLAALDRVTDAPAVPSPFGECQSTRGGAWSVVLDPAQKTDEGLVGSWTLLHVDKRARVVSALPVNPSEYTSECSNPNCLDPHPADFLVVATNGQSSTLGVGTFDWDGDGEAELYASIDFVAYTTARDRTRIWTFKNGQIKLYPRGRDLDARAVKDFDSDGRPDLIVHIGGGSYSSPCSSRSGLLTDPLELLAHSLPGGGFSMTDDVAIAFAKHECPPPESTFASQKAVLCARVWGNKPAEIAKALAAGCKANGPVCGTECEDHEALDILIYQTRIPLNLSAR